jgi:hypothetical protein
MGNRIQVHLFREFKVFNRTISHLTNITGNDESGSDEDSDEEKVSDKEDTSAPIIDHTETNLIALRRVIYLTIQVLSLLVE